MADQPNFPTGQNEGPPPGGVANVNGTWYNVNGDALDSQGNIVGGSTRDSFVTQVDDDGSVTGSPGATYQRNTTTGQISILHIPPSGGGGAAKDNYVTSTDTDGSVTGTPGATYQRNTTTNAITVINRPTAAAAEAHAPTNPQIYADKTSPSGYTYGPTGQAVNWDGSPLNDSTYTNGYADPKKTPAATSKNVQTAIIGGSLYQYDDATGKWNLAVPDASSSTSGIPKVVLSNNAGSSGYNSTSSAANTLSADTAANNATSIELEKMREQAAVLAQQASAASQAGLQQQAEAFQSQSDALNRQVTLQTAAMGRSADLNKAYLDALQSDNPTRFLAFLEAGGGDINNALAGGNTALGPESILAGARAKELLDQNEAVANGGSVLGGLGSAGSAAGGGAPPVASPGGSTPVPPVVPPVTPPAQTPAQTAAAAHAAANAASTAAQAKNQAAIAAQLAITASQPTPNGYPSWEAYAKAQGIPMQGNGFYPATQLADIANAYGKSNVTNPQPGAGTGGMVYSGTPTDPFGNPFDVTSNNSAMPGGAQIPLVSHPAPVGAAAEVNAQNNATPIAPGGQDNLSVHPTTQPGQTWQQANATQHIDVNTGGLVPGGATYLAAGGLANGGLNIVGDSPSGRPTAHEEAVIAPQGAMVIPHAQTMALLHAGGLARHFDTGGVIAPPAASFASGAAAAAAAYQASLAKPASVATPIAAPVAAPVVTPHPVTTPVATPAPVATTPAPVATPVATPVTHPVTTPVIGAPTPSTSSTGTITNPNTGTVTTTAGTPPPVTTPVSASGGLSTPAVTASPAAGGLATPAPVVTPPQTAATSGTPTTASSGTSALFPTPVNTGVDPGNVQTGAVTGGLAPTTTTGGLAGSGTILPTSGYGVTSPDPSTLGITPTDQSYMDAVAKLRGATQVPNINPFLANWSVLDPTLTDEYEQALLSRYAIPLASTQAEQARYALRGINRAPTFGTHVASSY